MNNFIKIALRTVFSLLCLNAILFAEDPAVQYPNGIAAVVGKRIITLEDVHRKMAPFLKQLQKESDFQGKLDVVAREVLDKMIEDILLVNEFTDKKMNVPDSYLENHHTKFLVEQFQGNRSHYLEYLSANGITDREFKEQQKEEIIIGYLRNSMRKSEAEISPKQICNYYDEHKSLFLQGDSIHLRQIVLRTESNSVPEKAQTIISKLREGDSFTDIAKEFSEDDMRSSGGDWGWINRSDIREELAKVAFALNKGEFSEPIILNNHTFILFVEDKKLAGLIPLEKVREDIEKILVNEYAKKAEAQHIQKLRKKAHIRYFI